MRQTGKSPRTVGYIRTSTENQAPDRQIMGLEALCDDLYIEDSASAGTLRRPQYEAMRRSLQPGDTVIVWALDRAYRSTVDAITEIQALRAKRIGFRIATMNIDPATPDGMLVYTIVAALAEWERAIIRQRTREGLAAAKQRGVRLGRPPKLSPEQIEQARADLGSIKVKDIASALGVAPWTLRRALRKPSASTTTCREGPR